MKFKIPKSYLYLTLVLVLVFVVLKSFVNDISGASDNAQQQSSGQNSVRTAPTITPNDNLPSQRVREISVTAKQFEFTPNPIKVKLGELVRLKMTSIDVTHGFSLPEYGINEVIEPNQTVSIEFQATRKGTFPFACSVACGIGHSGMQGTLVVE